MCAYCMCGCARVIAQIANASVRACVMLVRVHACVYACMRSQHIPRIQIRIRICIRACICKWCACPRMRSSCAHVKARAHVLPYAYAFACAHAHVCSRVYSRLGPPVRRRTFMQDAIPGAPRNMRRPIGGCTCITMRTRRCKLRAAHCEVPCA